MAVGMFSWPSLHERMCRTWGSNSGPLACQANSLPIEWHLPNNFLMFMSYSQIILEIKLKESTDSYLDVYASTIMQHLCIENTHTFNDVKYFLITKSQKKVPGCSYSHYLQPSCVRSLITGPTYTHSILRDLITSKVKDKLRHYTLIKIMTTKSARHQTILNSSRDIAIWFQRKRIASICFIHIHETFYGVIMEHLNFILFLNNPYLCRTYCGLFQSCGSSFWCGIPEKKSVWQLKNPKERKQ